MFFLFENPRKVSEREDTEQLNEIQEFPGKIGRAGLSMLVNLSNLVNY